MDKKLRTAWTVAAILGVLLVIVTALWAHERGTFTLGAEDLAAARERLSEDCATADSLDTPACRDALDDLARLLGRFERRLEREQRDEERTIEGGATSTVEVGI